METKSDRQLEIAQMTLDLLVAAGRVPRSVVDEAEKIAQNTVDLRTYKPIEVADESKPNGYN